jgi:hypothetical protein
LFYVLKKLLLFLPQFLRSPESGAIGVDKLTPGSVSSEKAEKRLEGFSKVADVTFVFLLELINILTQ